VDDTAIGKGHFIIDHILGWMLEGDFAMARWILVAVEDLIKRVYYEVIMIVEDFWSLIPGERLCDGMLDSCCS
jgi:hypothetical protein